MKALVKELHGNVVLKEFKNNKILNNNEVLIKVDYAGICKTDIFVANGKIAINEDRILGHEFSGTVISSKSDKFKIGDNIACNPIFDDLTMLGVDHHGCFSDGVIVNASQLLNVGTMNKKLAAYIEPIAASLAPIKSFLFKNNISNKALKGIVVGDNRISKLTYQLMKKAGYDIKLVTTNDLKYIEPNSLDYIIETALSDDLFKYSHIILKKKGHLILKSRNYSTYNLSFYDFLKKEIVLEPLYYMDFDFVISFVINNKLESLLESFFGNVYNLEQWEDAFKEDALGNKKVFFKLSK